MTHPELVIQAERWLQRQGCGVTIRDPFSANTINCEKPDAIGWRNGVSILIECKVSRADFHADKVKKFRVTPSTGMGDWRFYMSPPDVIRIDDLPQGWACCGRCRKLFARYTAFPVTADGGWVSRSSRASEANQ